MNKYEEVEASILLLVPIMSYSNLMTSKESEISQLSVEISPLKIPKYKLS